jgi:hypothetical protein
VTSYIGTHPHVNHPLVTAIIILHMKHGHNVERHESTMEASINWEMEVAVGP